MSLIGAKPVTIPQGVTVIVDGGVVSVKGPKGELNQTIPPHITVAVNDSEVQVKRGDNEGQTKAYHGLTQSLISNMVEGVTQGYSKKLELIGTGYRARKQGSNLILNVGFSHPVEFTPENGIEFNTEGDTVVIVSGIDKQMVGETAAKIRKVRPPEPYKGKGIRYQGEVIRRKAGKATKAGA